jgi:hypothetical protein
MQGEGEIRSEEALDQLLIGASQSQSEEEVG